MTPRQLLRRFGEAVHARRRELGLSLRVLAKKAGMYKGAVIDAERGGATDRGPNPHGATLATVYRLAAALNCTPGDLLPAGVLDGVSNLGGAT